jgi:hypothetical protein
LIAYWQSLSHRSFFCFLFCVWIISCAASVIHFFIWSHSCSTSWSWFDSPVLYIGPFYIPKVWWDLLDLIYSMHQLNSILLYV